MTRPGSSRGSCSSNQKRRSCGSKKPTTPSVKAGYTVRKGYPLLAYASYTIRQKYPEPLHTYDGEARGEKRLINISDLTESYLSIVFKEIEKEEKRWWRLSGKEESKCEAQSPEKESSTQCQEIKKENFAEEKKESCAEQNKESCAEKKENCAEKTEENCAEKTKENCPENKESCPENKAEKKARKAGGSEKKESLWNMLRGRPRNPQQMVRREICAKRFYEMQLRRSRKSGPAWSCLKPTEKLPFYWKTLTGEGLRATAYSNFQQSFVRRFRQMHPRACPKRVRFEARTKWHAMNRSQRLPFVMQALLYHVSTGDLDLLDQNAVRAKFAKLKGRI